MNELNGLPLAGVLVLDLTRAVSGPFCTMNLGDMGARVIKVEDNGSGDECRQWGPPFVGPDSAYFLGINRNKESIALDLKSPAGRRALMQLCAKADVVIENFRPGVMKRLGADYQSLGREDLIYVSISGFGQDGPDAGRPGYDILVQAMSGLMTVSAYPDGPPVKCGFPVVDIVTSFYASQSILASLFARERTGKGRYVDISLLESMMGVMCSVTSAWLLAKTEIKPMGATQGSIVPYQIFRCADGMMVIGAPNERLWQGFCRALGREDLAGDSKYARNELRVQYRDELIHTVEAELAKHPRQHWLNAFEREQVPCGPVLSTAEILESPVIRERKGVLTLHDPLSGPVEVLRSPMRFAGLKPRLEPPPRLGEHTAKILQELG